MVSKLTLLARRRNGKTLTLSRARLRSVLAGRAAGRRGRDGAPRRAGGNGARPALAPHAGRESLTRRTVRQQATATIPILGLTDDMVGSGLVKSLARPGGNTTGVSLLATELDGKRQEILIEAVPGLRRMAALTEFQRDLVAAASGTAGRGARTQRRAFDTSNRQTRGDHSGIDILINNAGALFATRQITEDGLEYTFGAPFVAM